MQVQLIPGGDLQPKMWRGNSVSCQSVQSGRRLVLLVPGPGMEFPSTGRDQQPPARATGSQHPLLGKCKSLFFNIFNESSMTVLSSHRISVRTAEQWFYTYVKLQSFPQLLPSQSTGATGASTTNAKL